MARFVEFTSWRGNKVYVNPEMVSGFEPDSEINGTVLSIGDETLSVTETVPEVMAKLQGEPEPAKATDDIAGWWVGPMGDIYFVVGKDYWGRYVYQANGYHHLHTETITYLDNWTRDPNRKGWDR